MTHPAYQVVQLPDNIDIGLPYMMKATAVRRRAYLTRVFGRGRYTFEVRRVDLPIGAAMKGKS